MREDFGPDRGIVDGGHERDRTATMGTGCHVDREDAFEQLGPAQAGSRWSRRSLARSLSGGRQLVVLVDLEVSPLGSSYSKRICCC